MRNKTILLTGGAGFIGSHTAEKLVREKNFVIILDNLSSGKKEFVEHILGENAMLIVGDVNDERLLSEVFSEYDVDIVFHMAANPDVRASSLDPWSHVLNNFIATYKLLETMRKHDVSEILFTSSSTVYGEAEIIPTPEDYGPLKPISIYGATKLASEALITAYAHNYGITGAIFRFANVIGPRSTHGVIYDFINKLKKNPKELEILGDGTQTKSYLYIDDCVEGMIFGLEKRKEDIEIFNLGSEDWISVKRIAEIVVEEMGLSGVKFVFTGGVNGRGWKGDVKYMRLSIEKIKSYGWKPKYTSEEAVRLTARALIKELLEG
ncbi:MAG: UDP-glucose 4-epimerase [Thermoplasmata archaeon]|nr:SDR family NAD(P)-dependent oxidoreductase [Euryarchaeota archaeon]RLF63158.1 MAG: UDP-glucose 4-epimerase [Thermoplasmata archaeon]